MDVKKLELLASLRLEERAIKARIEEILPEINEAAEELESGTVLEVAQGSFTISKRRKWNYPEDVKEKEVAFKDAKTIAEQTGEATYVENIGLIFKASGEESVAE